MWKRIRQVFSALTARITPQDELFVASYLTYQEQSLFWNMNLPDQRHSLNVAYTAIRLAEGSRQVNHNRLIKCSLLHDIGKIKGDVSTADKIITVMADMIAPKWAHSWGRIGKGGKVDNLRHAFYIYFNHADRSAVMLERVGLDNETLSIIRKHHKAPAKDDPPELSMLRKADDLN